VKEEVERMTDESWRKRARHSQYVVIGPSGWIGSVLLNWISEVVGPEWQAQTRCFGSSSRMISGPDGKDLQVQALSNLEEVNLSDAIVFHLAYLTKDKSSEMSDADFFAANLSIDETVLRGVQKSAPKGLFVASSGAARDAQTGIGRNLYGVTKLLQEDRFLGHAKTSGLSTLVGRIFNIAGAHINKFDDYAISSFAKSALLSGKIEIGATIPVYRSFLGARDLIELVVAELLTGTKLHEAIDLCGNEILEMGQIAIAIRDAITSLHGDKAIEITRQPIDFSRSSAYFGDPRTTLELALRHDVGLMPFTQQAQETVAFMVPRLAR
jgi:UDP-glucuronate decarboxylase